MCLGNLLLYSPALWACDKTLYVFRWGKPALSMMVAVVKPDKSNSPLVEWAVKHEISTHSESRAVEVTAACEGP